MILLDIVGRMKESDRHQETQRMCTIKMFKYARAR